MRDERGGLADTLPRTELPDRRGGAAADPARPRVRPGSAEFVELRELLLGGERRQLDEVQRRLDAMGLTPAELAEHLPEAIGLLSGPDRTLARALAPTVEEALHESVRRNPGEVASAIYPVLGPAIRKAIAEALAELVGSLNRALESSFSIRGIRWRLEAWRTGVPYAQVVLRHALVYRVEQVLLIHAESGLLLAQAAPRDVATPDADLVSAMLTAIRDFVGDSFRQQQAGGLRAFSVGELTVMVEQGPRALLAAVIRGNAPAEYLRTLQEALEAVHHRFPNALAAFAGDTTPFAAADPILADCLHTVLADAPPAGARRRVLWQPWAALAVVLLGVLAWRGWRAERQWRAAIRRVESAPGLVVTHAERSGARWTVHGLRDPLAADPAVLLREAGADAAQLDTRFLPFVSLDPALVETRARAALRAPTGVSLRLVGDTLRVSGPAPLAWIAPAARVTILPPGVVRIDVAGVKPLLPPSLAALRDTLSGRRVYFASAVATLDEAGRRQADSVGVAWRRLDDALAPYGWTVRLGLEGRADTTGSEAVNGTLARERAQAVRAALAPRVAPAAIDIRALGTAEPLSAGDPPTRARVNRSVSVVPQLVPRPAAEAR